MYRFNHHAEGELFALVESLLAAQPSVTALLIAALDSDPAPAEAAIGNAIVAAGAARALGPYLLIDADRWTTLGCDESIFVGFDEVWGLAGEIEVFANPAPRIGSDRVLEGAVPTEVEAWMTTHGAVFGAGDGDGVNLVAAEDVAPITS